MPGLVLLFGMTFFVGMWTESFDRLWGAFLLRDIRFPQVGGLHPAMWFSLFACAAAVLGLGATEMAKRRTQRLGPDSVVGALLVLTLAIGAAVIALATTHAFVVVVATYLVVAVLRPVLVPAGIGLAGKPDRAVGPGHRAVGQGHVRQRRADPRRARRRRDRHARVTSDRAAGRARLRSARPPRASRRRAAGSGRSSPRPSHSRR